MSYADFLERKTQAGADSGFEPLWMPDFLYPFQEHLTSWAIRRGRAAIFADCGLGKTPMQLVWAENVARKTGKPTLILTPLAVGAQTVGEAAKFGLEAERSRDGSMPKTRIIVSNYEQLHKFDPGDFGGLVCDESSILKHYTGATQKGVTRFTAKIPYRLLCTATAAPNDYIELGTSAEALGELGFTEMRGRFFIQEQNPCRMEDIKRCREGMSQRRAQVQDGGGSMFAKLAYRVTQAGQWRLKGHAELPFWRWVCSWSRACRMPSDLGFDDNGFILPELVEREHIVEAETLPPGALFNLPAVGLREEREERRRTLRQRCELAAQLVAHDRPAVVWCHLNAEGDLLGKLIPDGLQVKGPDSDEKKEEAYRAFSSGELRVLITKPKIGAWGLNWQHCADVVTFASHSYEQYYQSTRRCWRFGQKKPVTVDVVATKGEQRVVENMRGKSEAAAHMFAALVDHVNEAQTIEREAYGVTKLEVPSWL